MQTLRIAEPLPSGFVVENATIFAERVSGEVRASAQSQTRPLCGGASSRVHRFMGVGCLICRLRVARHGQSFAPGAFSVMRAPAGGGISPGDLRVL